MLAIQLGWASSAGVDLIRFAREWAASEGAAMAVCRLSGLFPALVGAPVPFVARRSTRPLDLIEQVGGVVTLRTARGWRH